MTLVPEFDSSVLEYAATTTNASDSVTATPTDPNAEVTIVLGGVEIENGGAAVWETGENELVITVHGYPDTVYTVTVSYTNENRFGTPVYSESAINSAITGKDLPTFSFLIGESEINGNIAEVVADASDNDYTNAGIELNPENTVVAQNTKKYGIKVMFTDDGFDALNPSTIIQVDSGHISVPAGALFAFENLSGTVFGATDQTVTAGWNIIRVTLDTSTYQMTDFEVVNNEDPSDYILMDEIVGDITIEGTGGAEIFAHVLELAS